jgi:hypothetical protein
MSDMRKSCSEIELSVLTIQDFVCDGDGSSYRVRRIPRTRKHRYVWFADPKDEQLLKGKWERKPYPKEAAKQ